MPSTYDLSWLRHRLLCMLTRSHSDVKTRQLVCMETSWKMLFFLHLLTVRHMLGCATLAVFVSGFFALHLDSQA